MVESSLQSKFIADVKKYHLGLAVKVDCTSRRGWPDVTYVDWRGDVTLIEFKTDTGRLSPHQEALHEELLELGCDIVVLSGPGRLNKFVGDLIDEYCKDRQ